jgi:flagellar motility protein MotE (MotC chaperone)
MTRFLRDFRLIPVVLFATVCLLGLKVVGLLLDGGYTLSDLDFSSGPRRAGQVSPAGSADANPRAKSSWAQEIFSYPDTTSSITADKKPEKGAENRERDAGAAAPAKTAQNTPAGGGTVIELEPNRPASSAERAILERLGERRQELDARARELEIRENLLKSAEKQLDSRVNELKEMEQQANGSAQKKDEATAQRLKSLVVMYENMRAKDAAKIFDRLDMRILVDVVSQINPRRMSDILAQMQPEAAERLTVELSGRTSTAERSPTQAALPKIEGRPRP